jgi:hypothetical protein
LHKWRSITSKHIARQAAHIPAKSERSLFYLKKIL